MLKLKKCDEKKMKKKIDILYCTKLNVQYI